MSPTTAEGKILVSRNALRHGLRAMAIVLPEVESEFEWEQFHLGIIDSVQPANALELALAERAAELLWRIRRISRVERETTIDETNQHRRHKRANSLPGDYVEPVHHLLPKVEMLQILARYETKLSRNLLHVLHEIEALQARRNGHPAPLARLDVQGLPEQES